MIQPSKIFSAQQIKQADRFTIQQEPIASIELMERAAIQFCNRIKEYFSQQDTFAVFCGKGNNGGDGLAIARLLIQSGFVAEVFVLNESENFSDDCLINQKKLKALGHTIHFISTETALPAITKETIVIDAIFGTGLSRPAKGLAADCITAINNSGATIISVDIPSGLFADISSDQSSTIVKATHTFSFQFPKLAFFFPENAGYVGDWQILDIGLSEKFIAEEPTVHYQLTKTFVQSLLKPRKKFSHKGTFGHALLVAGSCGKIGAAVLAARACLRSGVGLLTIHLPECGYEIMQTTNPEAMVSIDTNHWLIGDEIEVSLFSAIGIGPGIGMDNSTQNALHHIIENSSAPLVLDADALNSLSLQKEWLSEVPENSILTPHPKEFERLAGKAANDFDRHSIQLAFSKVYKVYVVLKGAHTCITTPTGETYFNTTGNPGMAKGGSGDTLTGLATGLLAQGYSPLETCLLSVFIHGYAGDLAKEYIGEIGMTAMDICNYLPAALKQLEK